MKVKTKSNSELVNEALSDINVMKKVLNANTANILRDIAKSDIDAAIREGMDSEFEEDDVDVDVDGDGGESLGSELGDETSADVESPVDTTDADMGAGLDGDMGLGSDTEDISMGSDIDDIDLTGADDDSVVSVYKELSPMDEIEIVGDEIHLTVTEPGKYVIKTNDVGGGPTVGSDELGSELGDDIEMGADDSLGGSDDSMEDISIDADTEDSDGGEEETDIEIDSTETDSDGEGDEDDEASDDDDKLAESIIYEIYIDESDEEDVVEEEEEVVENKETVEEAIPVGMAQAKRVPGKNTPIKGPGAAGMKEGVKPNNAQYEALLKESTRLKNENEKFKSQLLEFKGDFAKIAVYNNNLSYAVKLFVTHPTTNAEKRSILERFDKEVKTMNEGKSLYEKINSELSAKKPVIESVNLDNAMSSSSSGAKLNDKNMYVDEKIIRLMEKVENRKLL